jgi:hypothetical protein
MPLCRFFFTPLPLITTQGLVEAQHNMGCIYLEKQLAKYDSIKALAWLMQADAQKFIQSSVSIKVCIRIKTKNTSFPSIISQNYLWRALRMPKYL